MTQVLFESMNKDYKDNKMLVAGKFLDSLIESFLEHKISKNQLSVSVQLPEQTQCLACKHITGRITKQNGILVMMWPSNRNESICMQSLLWRSLF